MNSRHCITSTYLLDDIRRKLLSGEVKVVALELVCDSLIYGEVFLFKEKLHHVVCKGVLDEGRGQLNDLVDQAVPIIGVCLGDALLEHAAAVLVSGDLVAASKELIVNELSIFQGVLLDALLDYVISVNILVRVTKKVPGPSGRHVA